MQKTPEKNNNNLCFLIWMNLCYLTTRASTIFEITSGFHTFGVQIHVIKNKNKKQKFFFFSKKQ